MLVQMAYKFGWKSPWCTKLVCRKHEGIPLHYKNITKHEKARTGVIVHLSSLRRREQYRYINLVKKGHWTFRKKLSEILRTTMSLTITTPTIIMSGFVTNCEPHTFVFFNMSCNSGLKKKSTHFQNIKSNIKWNKKKRRYKQFVFTLYTSYTTHLVHPWQSFLTFQSSTQNILWFDSQYAVRAAPSPFVWSLEVKKSVDELLWSSQPQDEREYVECGALWWRAREVTWDEGSGAQRLSPGWYWGSVAVK